MSEKSDKSQWLMGDIALIKALLTAKSNAEVSKARNDRRLLDVLWEFSRSGKPQAKLMQKMITTHTGKQLLASLKAMFPDAFKRIDKGLMKHMLKRFKK
jgi:hypothetical protein